MEEDLIKRSVDYQKGFAAGYLEGRREALEIISKMEAEKTTVKMVIPKEDIPLSAKLILEKAGRQGRKMDLILKDHGDIISQIGELINKLYTNNSDENDNINILPSPVFSLVRATYSEEGQKGDIVKIKRYDEGE